MNRVDGLDAADRDAMYGLMATYFDGVTAASFARDLDEKEWAVLLRDKDSGRIHGFSTITRIQAVVDGERMNGIFSGDTIVDRDYWGNTVLARVWSRYAFRLALSMSGTRVFWLLICSGYKTYRFLPVFFREFYPRFERSTPVQVNRILGALAAERFGERYDPERGIVRLPAPSPLKGGVADITAQRLEDPYVAFFARANPGHVDGDELVCLTELVPTNLTPAGRRMVGREIAGA